MTKNRAPAINKILMLSLLALSLGCSGSGSAGDAAKSGTTADAAGKPSGVPTPERAPQPPISSREIAKDIDLSKLPAIKGTKFGRHSALHVTGTAPGSVEEVLAFYIDAMTKQGVPASPDPNAKVLTKSFAQETLLKDGYRVVLTVMQSGEPKSAGFQIDNQGRFDTRILPRYPDATLLYGSPESTTFVTPASVDDVATWLGKALADAGWQEYTQAFAVTAKDAKNRYPVYRQKGYALAAMIDVPDAQQGKTCVQYSAQTLSNELPAPPDATKVEFDDHQGCLECNVPHDLKATAEFYRKAMPETGFKDAPKETPSGKTLYLSFHAENKDVVLVNLQSVDEKSTHVKIETYSGEMIEKMDQQAKEHEKAQADKANADKDKASSGDK